MRDNYNYIELTKYYNMDKNNRNIIEAKFIMETPNCINI
jgi:hypothetical protein